MKSFFAMNEVTLYIVISYKFPDGKKRQEFDSKV